MNNLKDVLLNALRTEIVLTNGCTDPVSVALAVSRAVRELGQPPDKIEVIVSPAVYRNAVCVGVPRAGLRGLLIAGALGAIIDQHEKGLAILDAVDDRVLAEARRLLAEGRVSVQMKTSAETLFVRATVYGGESSATATIAGDYSRIVEVCRNRGSTYSSNTSVAAQQGQSLETFQLEQLVEYILDLDLSELKFLIDVAEVNRRAAHHSLEHESMHLGQALGRVPILLPHLISETSRAEQYAAAAGEARMAGLDVPIMAVAGSGNIGITSLLPVLLIAESLECEQQTLARALAISVAVTVYIKGALGRITTMCGAAVAGGSGIAAATTYLLGGKFPDMAHAMHSVIGTLAGILCDGANETCAYKISAATSVAIQSACLAVQSVYVPQDIGLVGNTIEATVGKLGTIEHAMKNVDATLLKLLGKCNNQDMAR